MRDTDNPDYRQRGIEECLTSKKKLMNAIGLQAAVVLICLGKAPP